MSTISGSIVGAFVRSVVVDSFVTVVTVTEEGCTVVVLFEVVTEVVVSKSNLSSLVIFLGIVVLAIVVTIFPVVGTTVVSAILSTQRNLTVRALDAAPAHVTGTATLENNLYDCLYKLYIIKTL